MDSDYSKFVAALVKSGDVIASEMDGHDAHLMHMAIGISSESGELLDAIKRKVIYRKPLDVKNVKE